MSFENTAHALRYFAEFQLKIVKQESDLKLMMDQYKKETKEYFGVEDGRPLNLIQLANMIIKLRLEDTDTSALTDHDFTGAPV